MILVLTTTPNNEEAEILAEQIIEAKLAVCVQISPTITSFYIWNGKIQKDSERRLVIKTLPEKFDELKKFIEDMHSYETPEIISISAEKVSENYLNWAREVLKPLNSSRATS